MAKSGNFASSRKSIKRGFNQRFDGVLNLYIRWIHCPSGPGVIGMCVNCVGSF